MLFSDSEIEQIMEQAKLKCYPTAVYAKQWAIADSAKGAVMFGKESGSPAEIASQTKIMTAYVVLKMLEDLEIGDPQNYYVRVTKKAERVTGTKAGLLAGQLISILDCLYALMLPSGNDAALTLATAFGKYIHFANINERRKIVNKELKDYLK